MSGRAVSPGEVLELRYRRWLLAYPHTWRIHHEHELLTVLMDSASPNQRHPTPSSVFDLIYNGLGARWRHAGDDPTGRLYRDGVGVAGMASYTVLAAFSFALLLSAVVHPASLVNGERAVPAAAVAAVLFLASYGLTIAGQRKPALALMLTGEALAVGAVVMVGVVGQGVGTPRLLPMTAAVGVASLATVSILSGSSGRDTGAGVSRVWLGLLVALVVAIEIDHPWGAAGVTHGEGDAMLLKVLVGTAAGLTLIALAMAIAEPRFLIALLAIEVPTAVASAVAAPTVDLPLGRTYVLAALIITCMVLAVVTRALVRRHAERQTGWA